MLTSLTGSSDSSPTRLPIRQKGSVFIPLLPVLTLPPLPPITNPAIRRMSLTHSSAHSGEKSRKRDLIMNEAEAVLDYEKLEHVGDGLLTAAVITLLHDKYPAFGAGPATYLRGHMVSNRTLAQIAEQYKIPQMVIAEQHSRYMLQAGEKVKGSLFEAYVAGVFYSFLHPREEDVSHDVDDSSSDEEGLKGLRHRRRREAPIGEDEGDVFIIKPQRKDSHRGQPPPTGEAPIGSSNDGHDNDCDGVKALANNDPRPLPLSTSPASQRPPEKPKPAPTSTSTSERTHGQAFDHICTWLWPLFHPIAEFLKAHLGSQALEMPLALNTSSQQPTSALVPEDWKVEDRLAAGALGALNQFLGKTYGCGYLPTWLTKRKGEQVWKMTCILKTPEGKEIRSEAKRLTKRGAMKVAAYHVWLEVKAWEEEQAAKRAAEEGSDSDIDADADDEGVASPGDAGKVGNKGENDPGDKEKEDSLETCKGKGSRKGRPGPGALRGTESESESE